MSILKAAVTAAVVFGSATAAADRSNWPKSFTIGTASQGGTYYTYGAGLANVIGKELGITGGAEITGGPSQNMALVHAGNLAFGLTTMGPAAEALEGKSPLAPGVKMDKVCAMFPMYETPFSVTVLANSGIKSVKDIPNGAKIGFGPAASTSDTYFPKMLETLGVKFDRRNGSWSDLAGQLQDGLLDVIAFAAGVPVPAVSQLEAQTQINIIEFTEAEQKKLAETYPVSNFTIPANTYKTLKDDARSVSMWNFSIARCDLPEDLVYEVTKLVMENNDRMVQVHRAARFTVPKHYDKNNVLPYHPGAARWFKENGYDIPEKLIKK